MATVRVATLWPGVVSENEMGNEYRIGIPIRYSFTISLPLRHKKILKQGRLQQQHGRPGDGAPSAPRGGFPKKKVFRGGPPDFGAPEEGDDDDDDETYPYIPPTDIPYITVQINIIIIRPFRIRPAAARRQKLK